MFSQASCGTFSIETPVVLVRKKKKKKKEINCRIERALGKKKLRCECKDGQGCWGGERLGYTSPEPEDGNRTGLEKCIQSMMMV